jgi:dihydrofolate synthase/folylpolyglutamate synthase
MAAEDARFQATLEYLYERLPAYQRQGRGAFKKDLTNIRKLCTALGEPQTQFRSIHIGGTNGKGSVAAMLHSVLLEAGEGPVGLYTSPHLFSFTERIRVDRANIPMAWVADFVERIKPTIEAIAPSFFEVTVAMAFQYFAEQGVQWAVVEVGLGGRLDSTNILTPELSIITSIGMDHMDMLGDTLPQIAYEKAGIIKPERPVIIGTRQAATAAVFEEQAAACAAPLCFAEEQYHIERQANTLEEVSFTVYRSGQTAPCYTDLRCTLTGDYQWANLASSLTALAELARRGQLQYSEAALRRGLSHIRANTGFRGRMEVLRREPLVVADVGHNTDGLRAVVRQVQAHAHQGLHIVFGISAEKDVDGMLRVLPQAAAYYFVQAPLPRALPGEELARSAAAYNLAGRAYPSPQAGLTSAIASASPDDAILITGSLFVVAELLEQVYQPSTNEDPNR